MSIELILYLTNICENLNNFVGIITFIFISISVVCLFFGGLDYAQGYDKYEESFFGKTINTIKKYCPWLFVCVALLIFVPSERTIYLMLGANYFKNSILPPKVEAVLEKKLDDYLSQENNKDKK